MRTKDQISPKDRQILLRANRSIGSCEDKLQDARLNLLDHVERLLNDGISQAEIARVLGISKVTLHLKLKRAGVLDSMQRHPAGKARGGKQGKHPASKASK